LNLLNNNHTIDFTMADNPTSWANKTITPTIPIEQTDVATNGTWSSSAAVTNLAKLIDQNTLTSAAFTAQTTELKCTYSILLQEKIINSFSLTNSSQPIYFNKIELYASNTEDKNLPILVINNQDFAKSYETKQYSFFSNQNYKNYWITLYTDDVNYNLSEIQLIC
jgi:hypothetical protein